MIRMWWVTYYLANFYDPATAPVLTWYDTRVSRQRFMLYLLFKKHYREDFRHTFIRWYCTIVGKEYFHGNLALSRKQGRDIEDALDRCIKDGYIISSGGSATGPRHTDPDIQLTMNHEGRRFLKPLPFLNAVLAEYGYITSGFVGLLSGGVIVELISILR